MFNNQNSYLHLINENKTDSAVVVFPNVMPKNHQKFLISLLLSMGCYETEFDLYEEGTLIAAYRKAGLLSQSTPVSQEDIKKILREYILKFAIYVPGSHVSHDRNFLDASAALNSLTGELVSHETPQLVYTALQQECDQKIRAYINTKQGNLQQQLHAMVTDVSKPALKSFLDVSITEPLSWSIEQSSVTLNSEQLMCYTSIKRVIDAYLNNASFFLRHQFVVGLPGSGKSFVLTHALFYACCTGLKCYVTSLSSERAMAFGGSHINELLIYQLPKFLMLLKALTAVCKSLFLITTKGCFWNV